MRAYDEELIWKFLDGDLTQSEEQLIVERLELDERFRAQMADLRDLDQLLATRTAELPSLRFTTAVMEQIAKPMVVGSITLVPRKFALWYFSSFGLMLVSLLVLALNMEQTTTPLSHLTSSITEAMFQSIQLPFVQLLFQISIGIMVLVVFDRFLIRRRLAQ